jgi:hypothetical protein
MRSATVGPEEPSHRELAILRAVAMGRAEITCSCEPDLFIDGLFFSDQYVARQLAHRNLIAPARPGRIGRRVHARLTSTGQAMLDTAADAA